MKTIITTVAITLAVLLVIPLLILATGAVNLAASQDPSWLEKNLATWAVNRSVDIRAPDQANPFAGQENAISDGQKHYVHGCARCHGGPDHPPEEFAKGLNPPAPEIEHVAEEFSDAEIFWITKHGIRMTGMPAFGETHQDEDLWKIVAYVKTISAHSQNTFAKPDSGNGQEVDQSDKHHHSHESDQDDETLREH